ncbi:MAG: hypothetical protein WCI89_02990 [bacterium]
MNLLPATGQDVVSLGALVLLGAVCACSLWAHRAEPHEEEKGYKGEALTANDFTIDD